MTAVRTVASGQVVSMPLVFEAVLKFDPDAADAWAALGVCMAELGQPEAALTCQREVLRAREAQEAAAATSSRSDSSASSLGTSSGMR